MSLQLRDAFPTRRQSSRASSNLFFKAILSKIELAWEKIRLRRLAASHWGPPSWTHTPVTFQEACPPRVPIGKEVVLRTTAGAHNGALSSDPFPEATTYRF